MHIGCGLAGAVFNGAKEAALDAFLAALPLGARVLELGCGNGMDAALLSDYMESFKDPRAYAISHIGWGLLDTATWYHRAITRTRPQEISVNSLSYYGNVLFSTGPNTELGGKNDTMCHMDIPLRKTSLSLDGVTIVDKGKVVIPEMAV